VAHCHVQYQPIAIQDIHRGNILIAQQPESCGLRYLLTDFEFSQQYQSIKDAKADLWWFERRTDRPAEGIVGVNPFAFDMLCVGRCLKAQAFMVKTSGNPTPTSHFNLFRTIQFENNIPV
jgi:hypothetical protein